MTVQDVFIFITHFYVFVPGKLHIPGGSVYGRPDFCGNLYHTPANTTILSSVRLNGETAYTIYRGGTTREKFLDYLKNTLIPTPHEGDIVVQELWVVSRIPVKIL